MPKSALSLWPSTIRPSIKSPATILAAQAKELALQTDGALVGELKSRDSEDSKQTVHTLDVYAPALDYRHRVLTATHAKSQIYPVLVDAEMFRPRSFAEVINQAGTLSGAFGAPPAKRENEATSDDELIELVKRVLNSPQVVAVAISLIAKAEEIIEQQKETGDGVPSPASE